MHRLPQGYVLIKDKNKIKDDDEEVIPLEEQIEAERAALQHDSLTPVTLESFKKWKEDKAIKKQQELEARLEAEKAKGSKGKAVLSGKALFTYDPTLFQDDDGAADDNAYDERSDSDNEESKQEVMPKKQQQQKDEESKEQQPKIIGQKEPEVDEDLFKDAGEEEEEVDFD